MKKDIHPKYYSDAKISCVCGAIYTTGSVSPAINVEICSACHPFFTGKQNLVDTARRVEKYTARAGKKTLTPVKGKQVKLKEKESKRKVKVEKEEK